MIKIKDKEKILKATRGKQKEKKKKEKQQGKSSKNIQGNYNKENSSFFCRNYAGQKGMVWYI